jgi:hypothetical protein
MTMLPHALRLLTLPRVEATLHFSPDRFIPAAPAPNAAASTHVDHHHQAARNAANRAHDIVLAMLSSRPSR